MPANIEDEAAFSGVYDVIIVGAGPCGLALAARLRERHPSALFTDEEQARYSWINRNTRRAAIRNKRSGRVQGATNSATCPSVPSMLVLDDSGTKWMSRWKAFFLKLQISHLRSPMFFHPDPSDRDALLAYIYKNGSEKQMQEIRGCVGKEISKHRQKKRTASRISSATPANAALEINERDRFDYFAPSSSCFNSFCAACEERYGLNSSLIREETVQDIDYEYPSKDFDGGKAFVVRTNSGSHLARSVVLAVGGGSLLIPSPFSKPLPKCVSHVMAPESSELLNQSLRQRLRSNLQTNVLVVGGGLTGAQVADAVLREGVSKVWLLMRGPWKVKPFDIDLSWMSKFKNHEKARFWSSDSREERLAFIKEARNGGSITQDFAKILKKHIQHGRLSLHQHTIVKSFVSSLGRSLCTITTDPSIDSLPSFDHVYLATGVATDVQQLPYLRTMHRRFPISTLDGYPCLSDDLMWSKEVPLFFTGKLATLELGPGAANLEGARLGAERVAWAIEEQLNGFRLGAEPGDVIEQSAGDWYDEYIRGRGSKFSALALSNGQ